MKNNLIIKFNLFIVLGCLFLTSCKKSDYLIYDKEFAGIYFQMDSIYYSFGVTPIEISNNELKVPVKIIGKSTSADRTFSVMVKSEKTTAVDGQHYSIAKTFTIKADSINGYIPLNILRKDLGTADYKISLKLVENENFTPVNEKYKETLIHFNNRVERPSWKDWQGNPTWPEYELGAWNPLTYIKFIELFRAIEQKSPATYKNMIEAYGPDLQNVTYGWPYDYNYTMVKYVLIPLYEYFMVDHPELGVIIPRPYGY